MGFATLDVQFVCTSSYIRNPVTQHNINNKHVDVSPISVVLDPLDVRY